ncbi:Protein CBG27602 [Caenorhabditis briggsae]|uniref:Uncharacterized protein n=2 Tax=Caenorhabditis briggsae TaxID=6238 RepID=A0AAE9CUZ2_CAEBR|nr:Protein CBG27602 [Caenorhabditis briggsae]ULT81418.1 hypothetical protein L3Y34_011366 [Caenorhabditis briggsae]CAS00402.1 Protein CBG27602 [Caenorhabditis briggsae]
MPGKVTIEVKDVGNYYADWGRVDYISDLAWKQRDCVLALGKNEFHMKYTSFFLKARKVNLTKLDFRDKELWEEKLEEMKDKRVAMIATDLFLESKMRVPKNVIVYWPPEDLNDISKIFELIYKTAEEKRRTYKVTFFVSVKDDADYKTALIEEMEKRKVRVPSWLRESLVKSLEPTKKSEDEKCERTSVDSELDSASSSSSSESSTRKRYNEYGYIYDPKWNMYNGIFSQAFWDACRPGNKHLIPRKVKPSYWGTYVQKETSLVRMADGSFRIPNPYENDE